MLCRFACSCHIVSSLIVLSTLASGDRSEASPGESDSGRVDEISSGDSLVVPADSSN